MKDKLLFFLFFIFFSTIYGQENKHKNPKEEAPHVLKQVIISASRSERNVKQISIPASIISKKQINLSGSIRLNNILQEQTGLSTFSGNHGMDLQIQGLQSKHILFLIDDEPIIGRATGILDLNRISLSNISHIEVIKGPSSVLYGSDALGGVINLITSTPREGIHGNVYSRYGENLQWNTGFNLSNKFKNSWFSLYLDHYQGINKIDNSKPLERGNPFRNYTLGGSFSHNFSDKIEFKSSLRGYLSKDLRKATLPYEKDFIKEYALSNRLNLQLNPNWKTSFRFYRSHYGEKTYREDQNEKQDSLATSISQILSKPEILSEYRFNEKNILSSGLGFFDSKISGENRYKETKSTFSKYIFSQYEWNPLSKLHLVGGFRYESDKDYGRALLPKFSFRYDILPSLNLKTSIGRGFKAPDFRMLYLNFDHSALGYYVYGLNELPFKLKEHKENGQLIGSEGRNLSVPLNLKPEYSWGTNMGLEFTPNTGFRISMNFFHNQIKNLIDSVAIAEFRSNSENKIYQIFSYENINEAFTKGVEIELRKHFLKYFYFSAGYQYLDSGDQSILNKIREDVSEKKALRVEYAPGKYKNATLADYPGLAQRSRHSANAKIFYEDKKRGFFASLRGIYMSKYYMNSLDSKKDNQYIELKNYIKENITLYLAIGKKLGHGFDMQIGIDNLFNYQDSKRSGLPGRIFWGRLSYLF